MEQIGDINEYLGPYVVEHMLAYARKDCKYLLRLVCKSWRDFDKIHIKPNCIYCGRFAYFEDEQMCIDCLEHGPYYR
jgi:hypothetical protein